MIAATNPRLLQAPRISSASARHRTASQEPDQRAERRGTEPNVPADRSTLVRRHGSGCMVIHDHLVAGCALLPHCGTWHRGRCRPGSA